MDALQHSSSQSESVCSLVNVELATKSSQPHDVETGVAPRGEGSGMAVTFSNLSYSVKPRFKPGKTILENVSGFLYPGNLTAIMGPSGSGKTTLLDLVACRKNTGTVTGELLLNGQPLTEGRAKANMSYVEQTNTLLESLTVEEMLMYTAALCWPWKPREWRQQHVNSLISTLGLEKCRGSLIGGTQLRGVSGGEARRTFVGVALVAQPQVLLLDEPTSGLDSFRARELMSFIKLLVVQRGITVATTIHQPSNAIFSVFDRLMLVLRGRIVFFGEVSSLEGAFDDLYGTQVGASLGSAQSTGGGASLSEAAMDFICTAEQEQREVQLAKQYEASPAAAANNATLDVLRSHGRVGAAEQQALLRTTSRRQQPEHWYQLPMVGELKALLKFRNLAHLKHPAWWFSRVFGILMVTFFLTTVYVGIGDQLHVKAVQDTSAVLFLMVFNVLFMATMLIGGLVVDRPVFYHEHGSGLYSSTSYMAAQTLLDLLVQVPMVFLFTTAIYFIVQLQGSFMLIVFVLLVMHALASQMGFLGAALGPTTDSASIIVMFIFTFLIYTSGFYVQWETLNWGWKWIGYINPLRYSFFALIINQYEGAQFDGAPGGPVLDFYGLTGHNKWAYAGYAAAAWPVVFAAAWLSTAKIRHIST